MTEVIEKQNKFEIENKCGEIFHSENNFIIICTECHGKQFNFQEFVEHFQVLHSEVSIGENKLDFEIEDEEFYSGSGKKDTCVHAKSVSKRITKNNKLLYSESDETPFESITLEQRNSPINRNNDDNDFIGEDLLQTNAEVSLEQDIKVEKIVEKEKIPLELRKTYSCDKCDKRFVSESQVKLHTQKKHSLKKNFECYQCNEVFRVERSLKNHIRIKHEKFQCTNCGRTYKTASNLREHMLVHKNTSDFVCDFENCGKSYKSLTKLRRHQRLHSTDLKHVCEICGYRTRENHVLVVHLRTHTGERPFPCNICGKHFISQSMVREHQATHAVLRNHECEVCGATFSRPKALYHHKHLHLGIKKFVCRICDKAYSQAAGLSAHMRLHKVDGKIM